MASLVIGENSWATVVEANNYFDTRYNSSDWITLTILQKTALLITAFFFIKADTEYSISDTNATQIVKRAQYEMAWFLYKSGADFEDRIGLQSQGVTEISIGNFRETYSKNGTLPLVVSNLLDAYKNISTVGTFSRKLE